MLGLPHILMTVAGLLVLIGLLQPLAARFNLSHTVLLAVVGVCIGVGAGVLLGTELPDPFDDVAGLLRDFPITSQGFLFIFLPLLLFEAALSIDVRRMLDDAAPIFLLAVIAVLVTTGVVGLALWPAADVPLVACFLLGAIVATTDPAAVVAIFRDLGAPARLSRLIEGESLLNDATAIAVFSALLALLLTERDVPASVAITSFVTSFTGGALVGIAAGRAMMAIVPRLRESRLAEMTLTLALPYLVYVLCESYLQVSGVVAVVAAGLVVSAVGRSRFTPESRAFLNDVWQQLAFWASSLVFILASMLVPRLLIGAGLFDLLLIGIAVGAALLARALVLFGLLPLLSTARLAQRVSHPHKLVILWGGLRGAVTLALALAVTENRFIDTEIQQFVATLATGFVLFTLFVQGPTLRPIIHLLKLDRLSPIDQALRHQVLALALTNVRDATRQVADEYHLGPEPAETVLRPYEERIAEATRREDFDTEIADRDRVTLGLLALANRERELVLAHFRHRTVSRRILERLLADVEDIVDGIRSSGRTGYNRAARRQIGFGPGFRFAHVVHRYARIERLLVKRLADRFELLLVSRMVLEELERFVARKMTLVLGARLAHLLSDIVGHRREATAKALDALRLQYPGYADALEIRFLRQSVLRLEAAEYETLFEEGLIGHELYNHLRREVQIRRARAVRRPRLDLGLDIGELVRNFPLFSGLPENQLVKVSGLLKPHFAVPGEVLIRRGERGDAMYFISSGAVEVAVGTHRIRLGRGDFFGEMALLGGRPRQADVKALGYGHLLALREADFRALLATDAGIREHIEAVADARRRMNEAELTAARRASA